MQSVEIKVKTSFAVLYNSSSWAATMDELRELIQTQFAQQVPAISLKRDEWSQQDDRYCQVIKNVYIPVDFYNIQCKRCFPNDEEYFGGLKKRSPFKRSSMAKCCLSPKKG